MRIASRPQTDGPRRATNLSIREELLAQAKEFKINVSKAAELGLTQVIAEKRAESWLVDNAEALDSSNRYVEKHGLPLARHRRF